MWELGFALSLLGKSFDYFGMEFRIESVLGISLFSSFGMGFSIISVLGLSASTCRSGPSYNQLIRLPGEGLP